jgi:hypothetical protein
MSAMTSYACLTEAPADLAAWVRLFAYESLPVLASTAQTLEDLRAIEDSVDAHMLSEAFADDPLMTIKVLAHVAKMRASRPSGREGSDTETVLESLVMLGISPFFSAFGPQATVEDQLSDQPLALEGFRGVLQRSRRAARFAMGFAVHRMDHDAPVIHDAALIHDFTELLLWLRAPALALQIQQRQLADPTLRSAAVQREVLNIELPRLEHALMVAWKLPKLLVQITDDHAPQVNAQMRNVQLALRVARHSALCWDNAALPDDVRELGELLTIHPEAAARLVREIDAEPA